MTAAIEARRPNKKWSILVIACTAISTPPISAQISEGQTSSHTLTLKTATRLVEVDVVVTDSKNRPVTGLTVADFRLEEDATPQSVRSFETYTLTTDRGYVAPKAPQLPPNTYLNLATASETGPRSVVLYDALNTPLDSQAYALQSVVKFLAQPPPGNQIAVFVLSDKLRLAKGFDEDLCAASEMEKKLQHLSNIDRWNRSYIFDHRVPLTLDALKEVGLFLSPLPGRKNLIWYSGGIPESVFHGPTVLGPLLPNNQVVYGDNYSELVRQAADLLNLSHVAVYPIDVRAVSTDSTYNAASKGAVVQYSLNLSGRRLAAANMDAGRRATMDSVADGTGGRAFYGTNDLEAALSEAITSGSTYYSLSYSPTNPKYDGSLRHIKVTLKKSGYTLAYRKTYYADDLEAAARAAADAPVSPLSPSLERGTPLEHGLFVEAHLDAAGAPVPATPAQMQVLSQYASMQMGKKDAKTAPVMMQQYFISYGLIARQLDMPEDNKGAHQASLEFGMIFYDDDGRKLNGLDTRVDDTIPPPRYAKLAMDGYHAVQSVAVPVTATSLRLAVRDVRGNRVGSLEVKLPLARLADANTQETKTTTK